MSLDIYLTLDACEHCGRPAEDVAEFNVTYNLGPMWREAGFDDRWAEGRLAWELVPSLVKVIRALERNCDHFDAMNPPNGWGTRRGLVRNFLGPLYAACRRWPGARVGMWR